MPMILLVHPGGPMVVAAKQHQNICALGLSGIPVRGKSHQISPSLAAPYAPGRRPAAFAITSLHAETYSG